MQIIHRVALGQIGHRAQGFIAIGRFAGEGRQNHLQRLAAGYGGLNLGKVRGHFRVQIFRCG
ncbi:hypothetical protein JOS77_25125 [Chromobacterium haemolyticum]|nr:hypothetical protein JOS77_25125 [Chromobacterium haemolyticum]